MAEYISYSAADPLIHSPHDKPEQSKKTNKIHSRLLHDCHRRECFEDRSEYGYAIVDQGMVNQAPKLFASQSPNNTPSMEYADMRVSPLLSVIDETNKGLPFIR